MARLRRELESLEPEFSGALTDAIIAGWLGGSRASMAIAGDVLPPPSVPASPLAPGGPGGPGAAVPAVTDAEGGPLVEFPSLEAALRKLIDRQILSAGDFYLAAASARQQAFTITADVTTDTLERVRDILAENIRGPAGRERFAEQVAEDLGSLPISPAHMEHVFRNATNEAYSQGMEAVLDNPLVGEAFPYVAYFAIHDDRVRPEHLALETGGLSGTNVYNRRDPVWRELRPPWSWQCRCGWVPLAVEDAASLGVAEAKAWLASGVPPRQFEFVKWPEFEGQPIFPPASWRRAG